MFKVIIKNTTSVQFYYKIYKTQYTLNNFNQIRKITTMIFKINYVYRMSL